MISNGNKIAGAPVETAKAILRVVPLVMRSLRAEMRACRPAPLSVTQFRTLNFIEHYPGTSLSDVATHIGVTLPSMSRLVDGLVDRKLATRQGHTGDRRRLTLGVTARGRVMLRTAHAFTEASIVSRLSTLGDEELAAVGRAMGILDSVFAATAPPGGTENP